MSDGESMFQFALRRLSIIPLVLLIANFIGFAFAFASAPIVRLGSSSYFADRFLFIT